MFRSAVARATPRAAAATTATAVAAVAGRRTFVALPRASSSVLSTVSVSAKSTTVFASQRLAPAAVRFYSAAAGLERPEVESRILSLLQGLDKVDAAALKPTSHFANDLGLDSLDTVEVVMAIEEEFSIEIPDKDADSIHSVEQAIEYILHEPNAH